METIRRTIYYTLIFILSAIFVGFMALCVLVVVDFVIAYVFEFHILDYFRSWF